MPDMHSLCLDMPQALKCFEEQLAMGWQTGRDFETKLVAAFRCTKDFYAQHEAWVKKIVKESDCPMLIEILSDRVHYWVAKIDLAAIDGQSARSRTRPFRSMSRARPVQYQVPQGRWHPCSPADPPLLAHGQCRARDVCHI